MINPPPQVHIQRALNNAGSGLFASRAIEPGQEISRTEQQLVSVLDSPHLRDACANCYIWCPPTGVGQFGEEKGAGVTLKACLGCKINRYCSKVGLTGIYVCSMIYLAFSLISLYCKKQQLHVSELSWFKSLFFLKDTSCCKPSSPILPHDFKQRSSDCGILF